ncbi:hypothetical protein FHX42_004414 [Saccharopolyspora lacisalsi]|uniref:PPE domain-containing protein n=1 Tax=Halosaccharopolyspora lacisalsi TaxID=1000566 RepID=A0A839E1S6_9PSEU|nr:PPE domain-containing protein [Halosaccharopolyspora lacisalsi]MBA8827030.1 hypothetical protein [Halosaccharopolyspora lacisalsi]
MFGWLFGQDEEPSRAQANFDHQKIYEQWQSGPGVSSMSQAAGEWRDKVSAKFDDAHGELDRVLKDCEVAVDGAAGERMRSSVTPLKRATEESIEVASQVGSTVEQQAQASADFKHSFPEPYEVPSSNIGWADYLSPVSYGMKKGVHAQHEENHDAVAAEARRQYDGYTAASNDRTTGVRHFSPVPKFSGDVSQAQVRQVGTVSTETGTQPGTGDGSASTYRTSDDDSGRTVTPAGGDGSGSGGSGTGPGAGGGPGGSAPGDNGDMPEGPADSDSSWVAPPPATGAPAPAPGAGTGPGPGTGGGFVGGVAGGGAYSGGGAGRGGGFGGRTGTGTGTGAGTGRGSLPGGGRAYTAAPGTGGTTPTTSTTSTSSTTGARGVPMGGAAGRGQQDGGEDEEHETKYLVPTDEAWQDLDLPPTAPPVIGADVEPPKPPPEGDGR